MTFASFKVLGKDSVLKERLATNLIGSDMASGKGLETFMGKSEGGENLFGLRYFISERTSEESAAL